MVNRQNLGHRNCGSVNLRDYPTSFVRTGILFSTIWYYYTLIQIVLSNYTHDLDYIYPSLNKDNNHQNSLSIFKVTA